MSTTRCGCGAAYDTAAWLDLPLVGAMTDGADGTLSLRNCACDSTISRDAREELLALAEIINRLRSEERPTEWAAGDLSGTEEEIIIAQAKPSQNAALLRAALLDWYVLTQEAALDRCRLHGEGCVLSCPECVEIWERKTPGVRTLARRSRAHARAAVAP